MRHRVLIENPTYNTSDPVYVRYSHISPTRPFIEEALDSFIRTHAISPQSHSRVVDLCAGDGGLAHKVYVRGWRNITCVDQFLPTEPLVATAAWLTWNLYNLYVNIRHDDMDPDTLPHRNAFDLVLMGNSELGSNEMELAVSRFFVRPDGYIYLT